MIGRFLISGSNFTNTTSVIITDTYVERYTVLNNNLITGEIPDDAISGPVTVNTYGGQAISAGNLNINYPNINIKSISPPTGAPNNTVVISGDNFYRISKVYFGTGTGSTGTFGVASSGMIQVTVPNNVVSGFIRVISEVRNLTGTSTINFVPYPTISGFAPLTGTSGTQIKISGRNLDGATHVYLNNILTTGFTVINNTGIVTYVPSGNTHGTIRIIGASGVTTSGQSIFGPDISITGISPSTGNKNTVMTISGNNFHPELMYDLGNSTYQISFNGGLTGFYRVNQYTLTGLVPSNCNTGPVFLYRTNGSETYASTGDFTKVASPVVQSVGSINAISPSFVYSGSGLNIYIVGNNFTRISGITLTGASGNATGQRIDISGENFFLDALKTRINISGITATGYKTGYYGLYVSGFYGVGYATGWESNFSIRKF